MKNILYILITLVIATSCDFLDEEQYTNAQYDYFNTAEGLETGINGVYQAMRWYAGSFRNDADDNNTNNGNIEAYYVLTEYGTDFTWEGADGGNKDAFNKYLSSLNPGQDIVNRFWNNCYRGITRANTALMFLETVEGMSDETKRQRAAELKFLRAYFYFDLVQHYGGVPLVLKGNITEIMTDFPRNPVAEVYQQIISDLRAAYAVLPDMAQQSQRGRATRWSAGHLLAKVYLTRGSYDLTGRGGKTSDMDSAAYYARKVIDSGKFKLENDFSMIFDQDNHKTSSEIIWDVEYTDNTLFNGSGSGLSDGGNQLHMYWLNQYDIKPGMKRDVANGRPWRRVRINPDVLAKLWDRKNDARVYKTFKWENICNNSDNIPRWDTVFYVNPETNKADKNDIIFLPPDSYFEIVNGKRTGKPRFGLGDTALYISSRYYGAMSYMSTVNKSVVLDDTKYRQMLYDIGTKPYTLIPADNYDVNFFPSMLKWMDSHRANVNDQAGSRNFHRMRLAETHLIAAEAYGRAGKQDSALLHINIVRERAGWAAGEVKAREVYTVDGGSNGTESTRPNMQVTWADVNNPGFPTGSGFDVFVDWMLEERARELYGELNRWEDLVRTGTLVVRARLYNPDAAANIKDYHKLRPIPNKHINRLNPKPPLSEIQNPGYY